MDNGQIVLEFPVGARIFIFLQSVTNNSVADANFFSGGSLVEGKTAEA
jgi:hypothetical protein